MHLLVTDRLACPRCGPRFGLVLMAERLEERRIVEGHLGCANCRERYPVRGGFGDLRPPPREDRERVAAPPEEDPDEAFRLAALLGVSEGPGLLLFTGDAVGQASGVARMIDDIEVVAVHAGIASRAEEPGVTRIDAGDRLPFFPASFRGVVLQGGDAAGLLADAVRVLGPGSRLVYRFPTTDAAARLEEAGLELLLETGKAVVAGRA